VVFEILTFRLATGVDEATFRAIDERVQVEFAYRQPGFVRRTLGRHDDGRWLALTIWVDPESALDAQARFDESDLGREFTELVTDVVVERFRGVD
jgi:hypothetical protein